MLEKNVQTNQNMEYREEILKYIGFKGAEGLRMWKTTLIQKCKMDKSQDKFKKELIELRK